MKKKSTSQLAPARRSLGEGGFFNLRVLIGLFVFLAGIFLALFAFGPATAGFAQGTTRGQMAVALAQALNFQPAACVAGQEMFNDVPASSPFCPVIEELARRGITGGCGGGNYCPGATVTRAQMASFIVKAVADEPFHVVGAPGEPAFSNGGDGDCLWQNSIVIPDANPVSFFKDSDGIVHLAGVPQAVNGPGGNMVCGAEADHSDFLIFELPAGYQPDHLEFFVSGGSAEGIFVAPEGGVTIGGVFFPGGSVLVVHVADGASTTLDGFTFRAAPAATTSSPAREPASVSLQALRDLLGRK